MSNNNSPRDNDRGAHVQTQAKDRGPSMIAYTVKDRGKDEPAIWKSVGAAFDHSDGLGMDVILDAIPIDGRVTLREQRKQDFKEQRQGSQEPSRSQDRPRDQSYER